MKIINKNWNTIWMWNEQNNKELHIFHIIPYCLINYREPQIYCRDIHLWWREDVSDEGHYASKTFANFKDNTKLHENNN